MQQLHFSKQINAPREKVWRTLLDDATYRQWTSVFNPGGSFYKGDWSTGSKMLFIGPDPKTGIEGGMVSRISENREPEYLSIEHVGMLVQGVEDTTSEEVKKWVPAFENYTLNEKDGGTELLIDININEAMAEELINMWPEALEKLKLLAEQ